MPRKLSYQDCLAEMFGLRRFGIKLGLDTIRNILDGIGNPQNRFNCIHIAGTNGKGSIASALSTIFYKSGFRVGLYTSPHLVRFNERICIDNKPIADDLVIEAYLAVKRVFQGDREPTFFELSTAMALWAFAKQQVDWAVIETGMGGRLDATNVLFPKLCVISNISLEHREYLGNTLYQIAGEKAGIIKKGVPVITGVKQNPAVRAITEIAASESAPMYRLGKDFRIRRNADKTFSYFGLKSTLKNLKTGLMGNHQVDNSALVLAACEVLALDNVNISPEAIINGVEQNKWPGRLETVLEKPLTLLDGAHNLDSAKNLARHFSEHLADRKITLVIGILSDKPYETILKLLLPFCRKVVLTSPKIDRALPAETLLLCAKKIVADARIIYDVGTAVLETIDAASPGDVICVAGSLYVVGEAKEALEKRGIPSFTLNS
jgi:dihydrofolate synthase / folylpolyglutamate synthase